MTSNIGSDIILAAKELNEKVKNQIEELLQKTFRPEFLNRIDAIVFFRMLTEKDVEKIAHIQLDELKERLRQQDITFTIDPTVVKEVAKRGYVKEYGARPLKRTIQHDVAVPISQFLLKHPDVKKISVVMKKDKIVVE